MVVRGFWKTRAFWWCYLLFVSTRETLGAQSVDPVLREEVERDILVALFQYTNGAMWTRSQNWNSPGVHYCEWEGVGCSSPGSTGRRRQQESDEDDSRSITTLDLSENNLRGPVPMSLLLLLPNIRSLRLNGNNVDYSQIAQQELEVLGKNLDNLTDTASLHSNIQHLDVGHTTVQNMERIFRAGNGDTVIHTRRLKDLYASQAQIRAPFPNFLTEIPSLERLALDHNTLTGTLPRTIANWVNLKYLSLTNNQLTGTLPNQFNQMIRLRYLLAERNQFTGVIPIGLTSDQYTPLLEQIDLSNQRLDDALPGPTTGLSGTVPSFSTQKFMRRLDLSSNSFTGQVPSDLLLAAANNNDAIESNLDFCILSSNLITGSVPPEVLHRIPVDGLFLKDNKITDLFDCPENEFGCRSILCPPMTYEPRSGRQEEEDRPCLACPENARLWGQTKCRLEEGLPTMQPTPLPTRAPVSVPTTDAPSPLPPPTREPSSSPTSIPPTPVVVEKSVLIELYTSTGGDDWLHNDGWADPNGNNDFCSWHGVVCVSETTQSVRYLRLGSNNMLGDLTTTIYTLPNLVALDVSHNDDLTITFDGIERARSLEALDVSSTIVMNLDNLDQAASRLQELHMSDVGGFEGTPFPPNLYKMTNLRQLDVDYNRARGNFPDDLGNLSKLVIFSAANNDLSGSLPPSITKMTDLSILRFTTNHFTGSLPPHMEELSGLSVLDLSNQWSNGQDDDFSSNVRSGFIGPLPSFATFSSLRRLDIGVNSFTGTIPNNFLAGVDSDNLFEFADISENFLTGTVPSDIARLPNVYMQDNQLVAIDQAVCDALPADLLTFGCNAVMCAPGFYNQLGRQTSADKPCDPCIQPGGAPFFGSTSCASNVVVPTQAPIQQPTFGPVANSPIRDALRLIYTSCNGENWPVKNNWMDDGVHECLWDGVRCSATSNIIALSLRSNNLEGTFPSIEVFRDIPTLESLILDGNTVDFTFEGIGQASNLGTLDLTHTELDSVSGVEAVPNLKSLYMASNNLKGTLPLELLQITSLRRLGGAFNSFTGEMPTEITALSELEFLSLHDNEFTGSIPSQLASLSKLFFLLLQSNSFSGSIPTPFDDLTSIIFLDLSDQVANGRPGLSGPIPSFLALTSLKRLDLSNNAFTGSVPDDFLEQLDPINLEHVDLSNNMVDGTLPATLAKFPADRYDFKNNRIAALASELCDADLGGAVEQYGCDAVLCGPGFFNNKGRQLMDSDTCDPCPANPFFGMTTCDDGSQSSSPTASPTQSELLSDFEILRTFFDNTKGSVWHRKDHWKQISTSPCEWWGVECAKGTSDIVQIKLEGNNLLGTVISEIFQLPHLRTLVVESNNCHVDLSGIGNSRTLTSLDMSNTAISNIDGIGAARVLRELHIKLNSLIGTFPMELYNITTLEQIDFDFNSFSGTLGTGIGRLSNLKMLSVAKNKLSGTLPDQMRLLTDMVTLRLGRNSFTGSIPSALEAMTSLSFIDLSHQTEHGGPGLSGGLPSFESLSRLRELRLTSNAIAGTVPADFLENVDPEVFEYADLSFNALTGSLPSSLARLDEILLKDNLITGVAPELCDGARGPLFAEYGCNAVLCPPGTYNNHGRQESDALACMDCASNPSIYWGSTDCSVETSRPPSSSPPGDNEKSILIQFYQQCNGEEWDESKNWLSSSSICSWEGIRCVDGGGETVEAIELGANNVVGTPPSELFSLPNLQSLALYSNPLSGFRFAGIENAGRLRELLLDATGLQSLDGLEKATALELLNLRFNQVSGSMPTQIGQLTSLHTLSMAYNELTGTLPSFLEGMTNLKSLLVSNNNIGGNLHTVNFPASTRRLDFSGNRMTGSIPDSFLTLVPFSAQLEIDLSNNRLTGIVPADLIRFTNLRLYLKENALDMLPRQLCEKKEWNDGDVGRYGCDGILCPIGFYAASGRHSSAGACRECGTNPSPHLGASTCEDRSSAASTRPWSILVLCGGCILLFA